LPAASVDAVTSIAMMYGADDLNAFTSEVSRVLKPEGVWVVQFQDLLSVLQTNAVDWFVHEHLATFSLWSFTKLLLRHGLQVVDVEPRAINGGSLRVIVRKPHGYHPTSARVAAQLEREQAYGLLTAGRGWGGFLARVELVKAVVKSTIEAVVESGGTVDLYACSTKSILLLQLCDLDQRLIRQGIERQSAKVGRFVGDRGIPIVSEVTMRSMPPTALLLGSYQFRNQFIERERDYLRQGGLMICPLPHPEIIREGRSA
jgi:NDP-4-keto-2,6-dideoxyhexose 3-C-methyltransferase